ncbi:MAG: GNAT family N-acetyltransferase [Candidatus Aenigmatarchaeota archaeon]
MVEIRTAKLEDLKEIQRLNQILCKKEHDEYDPLIIGDWPYRKEGEEFFKNRIIEEDGFVVVAIKNNIIIGYLAGGLSKPLSYRKIDKMVELDNMFVLDAYRSSGIGSKLYNEFVKWCKKTGTKRILVHASAQNKKGIEFYKKVGFKEYTMELETEV